MCTDVAKVSEYTIDPENAKASGTIRDRPGPSGTVRDRPAHDNPVTIADLLHSFAFLEGCFSAYKKRTYSLDVFGRVNMSAH